MLFFLVQQAQPGLCIDIALIGGLAVPSGGFGQVFLHADPVAIRETDPFLRMTITLLRRFQVKPEGFGLIFRNADTFQPCMGKLFLRREIAFSAASVSKRRASALSLPTP